MYYVLPLMIAPLVTVYCSGPSSPLMVSTIECLVHTCHFLRPPSSSSCFPFLGKNKLSSSLSSMSSWFSQCHLLLSLGILPQLSISKTPIVLNLCSPSWGKNVSSSSSSSSSMSLWFPPVTIVLPWDFA